MTENPPDTAPLPEVHETANERFKGRFRSWFWGSLVVATVFHFIVFAFTPKFAAANMNVGPTNELQTVELPPKIKIPPPPKKIARPAVPVVASAKVNENVTIAPTTFESNPVENLPPPPSAESEDISKAPTFTPFTVRPRLKNQTDVAKALQRFYPPLLRDAGVSGTVQMWFFINKDGQVVKTQVNKSSGYEAFDEAAKKVAALMKFTPAQNRDKKVSVWVSIPIVFETQ
ncbi:MAG TPA: energy transducer TonB [Longimicrobiales bacterium]|nr:energy transducer TonB [Longimicrobiales bacterium]